MWTLARRPLRGEKQNVQLPYYPVVHFALLVHRVPLDRDHGEDLDFEVAFGDLLRFGLFDGLWCSETV